MLLVAAPARAADDFAQQFRGAELAETAFGDLADAAGRYRAAASVAPDAAAKARAELRAGSCLRRLGKIDEARTLLDPLALGEGVPEEIRRAAKAELAEASVVTPPPPAREPGPAADKKLLAEREHERDVIRAQLDAALQIAEGLDKEKEDLARKVLQQDAEIRAMRARLEPSSAEEALRVRIEEQERRRQADRELSQSYASFARRLYQEGRFTEARDFVYVALEKNAENAEAQALLTLVSAPLGVRARLYEAIRGVLALSGEVRGARTAAEIETLVAEAARRQERQEFAPSVAPLEHALALIDAEAPYLHDSGRTRDTVLSLLRAAQARGAQRSPLPPPAPRDDADARGLAAVRELLTSAGSEVARGLTLRFPDVGPVLAAAAAGLPPSPIGEPPSGWTISAEGAAAAPLLAQYLRVAEPQGFATPGASLEAAGSTLVSLCDAASQARLSGLVTALGDVTAPSAELRVAALRLAPGAFAAQLEARGIRSQSATGTARFAIVSGADLDAIAPELVQRGELWPSTAVLRATTLRAFRLLAGTASSLLAIDLLPVTRPLPGLAVRVATETVPAGRSDGARLRQESAAAALLGAGSALVVFGVADPADTSRDLAVVVRQGAAGAVATQPPPRPAVALGSSEMLLPASLRGLVEVGPEPFVVPGHPVPTRDAAIAARIRAASKSVQSVEVKDDRVRVVGPDEARAAARRVLDQIDVVRGVQAFDVAVYEISPAVEQNLLADLPRIERRAGENVARALVRADEKKYVERALTGTKGRLQLLDSRVAAPPTGRADAAHVVRSSYRRDLDVSRGAEPSWGRSETRLADEGLLVALRPFGRRDTGRVELDVSLRAVWIADRGERPRETPLGRVVTLEPSVSTWWSDLGAGVADDELLVLAGLSNPFARGSDRTRLVVTIAVSPPR